MRLGGVAGTRASFRPDNVLLLCQLCHAVQESADRKSNQVLTSATRDWLEAVHPGKALKQIPGYGLLRARVAKLFEETISARGWRTVDELVAKEDLVADRAPAELTYARLDPERLPFGPPLRNNWLAQQIRDCVLSAGGRVVREGRAEHFWPWYEAVARPKRPWPRFSSVFILCQRPREFPIWQRIVDGFAAMGYAPELLRKHDVPGDLVLIQGRLELGPGPGRVALGLQGITQSRIR